MNGPVLLRAAYFPQLKDVRSVPVVPRVVYYDVDLADVARKSSSCSRGSTISLDFAELGNVAPSNYLTWNEVCQDLTAAEEAMYCGHEIPHRPIANFHRGHVLLALSCREALYLPFALQNSNMVCICCEVL